MSHVPPPPEPPDTSAPPAPESPSAPPIVPAPPVKVSYAPSTLATGGDQRQPGAALPDRRHFLLIREGMPDICGQDGNAWPCPQFQQQTAQHQPGDRQYPAAGVVALETAARAAGMTVEEFQQAMRAAEHGS